MKNNRVALFAVFDDMEDPTGFWDGWRVFFGRWDAGEIHGGGDDPATMHTPNPSICGIGPNNVHTFRTVEQLRKAAAACGSHVAADPCHTRHGLTLFID